MAKVKTAGKAAASKKGNDEPPIVVASLRSIRLEVATGKGAHAGVPYLSVFGEDATGRRVQWATATTPEEIAEFAEAALVWAKGTHEQRSAIALRSRHRTERAEDPPPPKPAPRNVFVAEGSQLILGEVRSGC